MGRTKLSEKYHDEREEICKKLLEIVGTEFILCELDNDSEKQAAILALKDDIQKCFAVSSITAFKPSVNDVKREYLNIVRGILRQQGYTFLGTNFVSKENDQKTIKYHIFKK
jgi:hypothetical protein